MWKNTGGRWKKDGSAGLNDEKKSVRRLSTENFDEKERETPPGSAHRDGKKSGEKNKMGMAGRKGKQETKTVHATAALQVREGPQDCLTKRRATGASTGKSYGGKG